jgi:ubiquinone/menaquinone biosynthesis C-methylase UbiE
VVRQEYAQDVRRLPRYGRNDRALAVTRRGGAGDRPRPRIAPGPGYLAVELAKLGDFAVTGLEISRTFVEIAQRNALEAGVDVDFRQGDGSAMPFAQASFDFTICRSALKNFSRPVAALDEMRRVLRPGGEALIQDLRGGATRAEIDAAVDAMGLPWLDRAMTRWTFHNMLVKRAYTPEDMQQLVARSTFGVCRIETDGIEMNVWLEA